MKALKKILNPLFFTTLLTATLFTTTAAALTFETVEPAQEMVVEQEPSKEKEQEQAALSAVAEDFSWSLKNGVLTISGHGDMPDYGAYHYGTIDKTTAPWGASYISKVVIQDGITSIGEYAFSPQRSRRASKQAEVLNKVDKVTIPSNIKRIGNGAFYMCWGLKEVFVSSGVESIGNDAFYACDALKKITIPASVKEIGKDAFTHCFNLSIVAEEGTYAQTYAKENDIPFCIL